MWEGLPRPDPRVCRTDPVRHGGAAAALPRQAWRRERVPQKWGTLRAGTRSGLVPLGGIGVDLPIRATHRRLPLMPARACGWVLRARWTGLEEASHRRAAGPRFARHRPATASHVSRLTFHVFKPLAIRQSEEVATARPWHDEDCAASFIFGSIGVPVQCDDSIQVVNTEEYVFPQVNR